MANTAKPDMSVIWASAGASVQPPTSKIQEGWVSEKPPFQTENWVQSRQDQYLKHLDERGIPAWSNDSEYNLKAVAWYNDKIWESLQPLNVGNVPTDGLGFWLSQSYLDNRGGVMTGDLAIDSSRLDMRAIAPATVGERLWWLLDGISRASIRPVFSSNTLQINVFDVGGLLVATLDVAPGSTGLKFAGNTVWTAGNDGPGSGLDADLLDGTQLSTLLGLIASAGAAFRDFFVSSGVYTVPQGATYATFTVQAGGGGGGGGGDGGNSQGSGGFAGGSSTVVFPSGGVSIVSNGGDGGIGGGPSDPGIGPGGAKTFAAVVQGSTILTRNVFTGENGFTGDLGSPARGGNGGGGLYGQGGIGITTSNSFAGLLGGGGAGGFGQDNAPGGGGASATTARYSLPVTAGSTFTVTLGSGGAGGAGNIAGRQGTAGGDGFAFVEYS